MKNKKKISNKIFTITGVITSIFGAIGSVANLIDKILSISTKKSELLPAPAPAPNGGSHILKYEYDMIGESSLSSTFGDFMWLIIFVIILLVGLSIIIYSVIRSRKDKQEVGV